MLGADIEVEIMYKEVLIFIIGALVGSFLNVCIYRIPKGISIVFPASHCPHCKYEIPFYLNVPIIGWFIIRGRCRNCGEKISFIYPVVETISAINFLILFIKYGASVEFIFMIMFSSMCIVLAFIDLFNFILPDVITIPMIVIGLIYAMISDRITLVESLMGAVGSSVFLLMVYILYLWLKKQEGLGLGDVKMIAGIGAFLGWKLVFLTLFLSVISGAITGLIIMLRRKRIELDIALPFGFFLGLIVNIVIYYGDEMIRLYKELAESLIIRYLL
jgi:leader peptidase (prepilin peptidase)/N-methyltransferase